MITVEYIQDKFQEILGKQYRVVGQHDFDNSYTNPVETPFGHSFTVDYQAFEKDADVIVCVVNAVSTGLTNTPYKLINDQYTADFWVPLDFVKKDGDGNLLETPKFNFFPDMVKLADALRNTKFVYPDDGKDYQAFFTVSEPTLLSPTLDLTGSYTRLTFRVQGNISLSDAGVGTGSDIGVSLTIGGAEYYFTDITDFDLVSNTEGNAIQRSNSVPTEQDVALAGQQVVFAVDDYENGNKAMELVRDKAWKFLQILSPDATLKSNQYKVYTKLYKKGTLQNEFWGVLSAEYLVAGKTVTGGYKVSIYNDGRS